MENMNLTARLAMIAKLVPNGARFADIGCDHGKLTIHMLRNRQIAYAIAGDNREGPLAHAKQNAEDYGVSAQISFHLAPGLASIEPVSCDTIAIAGMGGETIVEILQNAPWTKDGAHTLLLQPMTMIPNLRQFLWAQGYCIEAEHLCQEEKRHYVVLQVRGGGTQVQKSITECVLSDALLKSTGARAYLAFVLNAEERALAGMQRAQTLQQAAIEQKQKSIAAIRTALEEAI